MSELKTNLQEILQEKQDKIIPGNIKKDVQIFDVIGTYEGSGSSEGVKLFETQEEMQADTNAQEGDLAVVYREEIQNMTADTQTQYITFPETVTLPTAFSGNAYCRLRAVDSSSGHFDGDIQLSQSSFRFNGVGDSGMIQVRYTSSDGINYTRTTFSGDAGDLTNPVDFGTTIQVDLSGGWDNNLGYFIQVGGSTFEGLYEYKSYTTADLVKLRKLNITDIYQHIKLPDISEYIKNSSANTAIFVKDVVVPDKYEYKTEYVIPSDYYIVTTDELMRVVRNGSGVYKLGVNSKSASDSSYYRTIHIVNNEVESDIERRILDTTDWTAIAETSSFNWNSTTSSTLPDINDCFFAIYTLSSGYSHLAVIETDTDFPTEIMNGSVYYGEGPITDIKYLIADTQLTLSNPDELLPGKIAYGKNGIVIGDGSIIQPDNTFADIPAQLYHQIQIAYDNMEPRVLTDSDKTIDKNIYFIPTNSNGEPLLDTGSVTNADRMFISCANLQSVPSLNTSKVTNMTQMFHGCTNLQSISLLDTNKVTNMMQMFDSCINLQSVPLLDTSSVTNMQQMFTHCTNLQSIPQLDTSNVTTMQSMFSYCTNLQSIPLLDTSSATDMRSMFDSCTNLTTIPLLDTSSATDMYNMFNSCTNLQSVPLLNTSKVTDMGYMFSNCTNLQSVPLLDTSQVTDMNRMFFSCTNLVIVPELDMSAVKNLSATFDNCPNLSDDSLNNILASLITATSYAGEKTLLKIGLSETQAQTCTSLSNWSACEAAGWTTGY